MDVNWLSAMSGWSHANPRHIGSGKIKQQPDDFIVVEQMGVQPCGSGEHVWLKIRKSRLNTEHVAKALARFAKVAYRDVGYSGLKDYFAVTEQWFSVWLPAGELLDWQGFELAGAEILHASRHSRKIKRGTHQANHFKITVRDLEVADDLLQGRLEAMSIHGVPNYFGPQRFGRQADNMNQVAALFDGQSRVKNRQHRGLLLSAARAWLFNSILSARVAEGTWNSLYAGEPANLDGSASVFISQGSEDESTRLAQLDIHPTAPLWGEVDETFVKPYLQLHQHEIALLQPYQQLAAGLISCGLRYQRRATRCNVRQLDWQLDGDHVKLQFDLNRGQYATSVLRELVAF